MLLLLTIRAFLCIPDKNEIYSDSFHAKRSSRVIELSTEILRVAIRAKWQKAFDKSVTL